MAAPSRRLKVINSHFDSEQNAKVSTLSELKKDQNNYGVIPKHRQDTLKWNGWGYNDSKFEMIGNEKTGYDMQFTGTRYPISNKVLPNFFKWVQEVLHVDPNKQMTAQPFPSNDMMPKAIAKADFLDLLKENNFEFSTRSEDRLVRSHGHTFQEIYSMLHDTDFRKERIPDVVVWAKCHEDVFKIVSLCKENNVVIIPIGGGTSVSNALNCSSNESRTILSLDLTQMLEKCGYCCGHEPDSQEFSTLGGWVATRASGMKKNIYGNIEDLVMHVKMVSTEGVIQKNCVVPRMSCGPDIHQVILGSEGMLGVITEVILKIRPKPEYVKCGSIIFSKFEDGVHCLREVARQKLKPASIRLMDNEQFIFGMALKPATESSYHVMMDRLKKLYITKLKGFAQDKMCVATLLFEGPKDEVELLERKVYQIAEKFSGLPAGEENGRRGYTLTFVIAYLRDCGLQFGVAAESFETSVPWDRVLDLCKNVKHRVKSECVKHEIVHPPLITCRVTQSYDSGACVYFYFAYNFNGVDNPVEIYEAIEMEAREEILANGGSISHHHGVGKLRKKWVEKSVSSTGVAALKAIKKELDPHNIFACNNLL
ncbi:Alkyldihydroxyacetonephosphate synthase, peroxisomal [Nymphon striatum]|nr:Alkyldihydroxyacetonephosphate synthase, peroxisomal [Nymphon striatum]